MITCLCKESHHNGRDAGDLFRKLKYSTYDREYLEILELKICRFI
jgi:hypothetical protein